MANTLNLGDGNWATKEDLLLGYNSENNNYKPLPFDFSRASSATRVNKDGLIETVVGGQARIDFKDDSKGALLLEPSRSNFYTQSNLFTFGGNVTSNNALSPDGSLNASKITKTSSSDQYVSLSWSASLSTSTTYSLSFFVKHNGDDVDLRYETNNFNDWGVSWNALFEVRENSVIASTVNNCTSNVINFGNGWYRVVVFVTTSSSITPTSPSNLIRVIGSDTKQFLMYGAMFEQGSYATSYIPTQGSAVTRVAEVCIGSVNDQVINSTEGVLYLEVAALASDLNTVIISLSDGTNSNYVLIGITNSDIFIEHSSRIGNTSTTINVLNYNKIALRWSGGITDWWVNGIKQTPDGYSQAAVGMNKVNFKNQGSSYADYFYGETRNLRVYNTALTDAQLTALTTI
tara:strand:+ start:2186 stop:3394 length:1209 start_codon:yes stop_codon:yes gene_type:complete